jgi:TonB family protein
MARGPCKRRVRAADRGLGFFGVRSFTLTNQTSLNGARMDVARYLNGMHQRIHPLFSDCFLESLRALPPSDARSSPRLAALLEIVIGSNGRITRMGIIRSSGVADFDIGALDSVDRAQPFALPPAAVRSADGNVYVQWDLHRDVTFACSTIGAQPFLLK